MHFFNQLRSRGYLLELTDRTGLVVKRFSPQLRTTIQQISELFIHVKIGSIGIKKNLEKITVTLFSKGLIWSISSDFWKAYLEPTRLTWPRFPFSPKFRKFRIEIKWNRPFRFCPTAMFGTTFEGGPLSPVRLLWSIKPECASSHLTKLLSPVPLFFKNNNQTSGGLGLVGVTGM